MRKKQVKAKKLSLIKFTTILLLVMIVVNFAYQIYKKPAELISLIFPSSYMTTDQIWSSYAYDFKANATDIIPSELLAALVKIESSGKVTASPKWQFKLTSDVTKLYAPASSSIGLLQITDGNLKQAQSYCVRNGRVLEKRAWYDPRGCWFNWAYFRFWPSHSIEMTSAFLHKTIEEFEERIKKRMSQKQRIQTAALTHLCGKNKAWKYVNSGFNLNRISHCGQHRTRTYLRKLRRAMREVSGN